MNRFLPPGARLLCLICIAVAILFMVAGCTTPAQPATTFDQWVKANVTVIEYDGPTTAAAPAYCGGHIAGIAHTAFIDDTCVKQWEFGTDPAQLVFQRTHEVCHDWLMWARMDGTHDWQGEANANTCAVAVTGTHPAFEVPNLGYVDPTAAQVRSMRLAMLTKGIVP